MGTNIYLVKKFTDSEIKSLKQEFDNALHSLKTSLDTYMVLQTVENALIEQKKVIHICKRSYGWQLLFQSHRNLYQCTWKSMTDYIRKVTDDGTYIMVDEYGGPYSLQDLEDDLKHFSNGRTGASYNEECIKKGERLIVKVADHEYISDGLRWTDSEFS